jgi:hypothetical protein
MNPQAYDRKHDGERMLAHNTAEALYQELVERGVFCDKLSFHPRNSAYFIVATDIDDNCSPIDVIEIRVSDHGQDGRVWQETDFRPDTKISSAADKVIATLRRKQRGAQV